MLIKILSADVEGGEGSGCWKWRCWKNKPYKKVLQVGSGVSEIIKQGFQCSIDCMNEVKFLRGATASLHSAG